MNWLSISWLEIALILIWSIPAIYFYGSIYENLIYHCKYDSNKAVEFMKAIIPIAIFCLLMHGYHAWDWDHITLEVLFLIIGIIINIFNIWLNID